MQGFYADLEAKTEAKTAESRALVVLEPGEAQSKQAPAHPSAEFLTQLLAVKAGVPQTRERRRAAPDEATHSYEVTMTPRAPRAGRVLSRAM